MRRLNQVQARDGLGAAVGLALIGRSSFSARGLRGCFSGRCFFIGLSPVGPGGVSRGGGLNGKVVRKIGLM